MTVIKEFERLDVLYEKLIQLHERSLKSFALKLTNNKDDAADLYQETTIKIYINMEKLDSEKTFLNWGMKIMERLFIDKKRYNARRPLTKSFEELVPNHEMEMDFIDPKVNIEADVMLDMVRELNSKQLKNMISSLNPECRSAISLSTYGVENPFDATDDSYGINNTEIARLSSVTSGNVRNRIHRAKQSLAKRATFSDYVLKSVV